MPTRICRYFVGICNVVNQLCKSSIRNGFLLRNIKSETDIQPSPHQVTMQNEQNNDYLIVYQSGILIDTLVRMYRVCDYEIPLYPTSSIDDKESTGAILRECLIANLKVLINITHDYQNKSE